MAEAVFQADSTLEHAETLAMALAEMGRFDEAIELQTRVVTESERRGQSAVASRASRRLESYQRGEPYRSPWKDQ